MVLMHGVGRGREGRACATVPFLQAARVSGTSWSQALCSASEQWRETRLGINHLWHWISLHKRKRLLIHDDDVVF